MGSALGLRLLLDTHVWLWVALEPERLKDQAKTVLSNADNELWLSPVSVWEAMLLSERGRIDLGDEPTRWIEETLRAIPARDAPLSRAVAMASRRVPLRHEDPADRFLAATAIVHDLRLVTADERLLSCGAVPTLQG